MAIKNLLEINVEWCYIMSVINGNSHCFRRRGPVLLDTLSNGWILRHPDILAVDDFLTQYPHFMKQRSDIWMKYRKKFRLTGSTMYNALGLRTLKEQKDHYRRFIKKDMGDKEVTPAMQHGIDHEVCEELTRNQRNYLNESLFKLHINLK